MIKRLISILLVASIIFTLAACGEIITRKVPNGEVTVEVPVEGSDVTTTVTTEPTIDYKEVIDRDYFTIPEKTVQDITETSSTYINTKPFFTDKEPYSNEQGYVEASEVVTKNGRTYIEHNGSPYVMHCIRIRADRIIKKQQMLTKNQWDTYVREYFKQAKKLGFDCVSFEVEWSKIEPQKDLYDFSYLDCLYSYCEEFDLNVQLIWFGSNNCGFYTDTPSYIREDTETYHRFDYTTPNNKVIEKAYIDYSDPDLIEREKKALSKLLEHLYQYDTDRRTVTIQILNEANACNGGIDSSAGVENYANREEVMKKTWVQGQKEAILNLMNELGMLVKTGPYRCVTRYNFISYECYNYAEGHAAYDDSVKRVYNLPGIDIVGMDCFDIGMSMDNVFMKRVANFEGNVPHIPESNAAIANAFAKQLNAFSLGGGLIFYEVRGTEGYDLLSLFELDDYEFKWRTGEKSVGGVLEASTTDWVSFNRMVKSAGYMLMTSNLNDFVTFNIDEMKSEITQTRSVGKYSIKFSTSTKASYGSVGFAMQAADGSYLFYSLKGTTTFSFENATLSGKIQKGYYDESGKWVKTGEIGKTGNGFLVTENQAANGTLFRITADQLS